MWFSRIFTKKGALGFLKVSFWAPFLGPWASQGRLRAASGAPVRRHNSRVCTKTLFHNSNSNRNSIQQQQQQQQRQQQQQKHVAYQDLPFGVSGYTGDLDLYGNLGICKAAGNPEYPLPATAGICFSVQVS